MNEINKNQFLLLTPYQEDSDLFKQELEKYGDIKWFESSNSILDFMKKDEFFIKIINSSM